MADPVEPRTVYKAGEVVVFRSDAPEIRDLPTVKYPDGDVQTEWELTIQERRAIIDGARIRIWLQTSGRPPQPIGVDVEGVEQWALSPPQNGNGN